MFEGTGNGMAKSLLDSVGDPCEIANAVHAIIRGFDPSHSNMSCPFFLCYYKSKLFIKY